MEKYSNTIKYVWKLENYSFCDFYCNKELESPSFTVHTPVPCKWLLYMFPNGCGIDKYVGIYLKRCSKDKGPKEISVRFKISLLNTDGILCPQTPFMEKVFTEDCEWGHSEFIKRSELNTGSAFLYHDILIVHCQITIVEPSHQGVIPRRQLSLQPGVYEGVYKAIKLIYEDILYSDMTLKSKNKAFSVHKCILSARLPGLFKKLESEPQTVLSDDFLTEKILLYAYCGKLDVKGVNPFKIRTALSEYGLHHLVKDLTPQSEEFFGLTSFSIKKYKYSWEILIALLSEEEEIISSYISDDFQETVFLVRLTKKESGVWSIDIKALTSDNDDIFVRCNISVRDPISSAGPILRSVFVTCEARYRSDSWWESPSTIQLENETLIFNNEPYVFDSGSFYIDFTFTYPSGRVESNLEVTTAGHSSTTGCNINNTEGLLLDLERLYYNEYEADTTIIAGNRQFKVHKCILCSRSPFFRAMFIHDMEEKENNMAELKNDELDDNTFAEVVDKLLLFIYCGKFEGGSPTFASLLLSAIEMYMIGEDY